MGKFLLKLSSLAAAWAHINACFLRAAAELAQEPDGASLSFRSAPEVEIVLFVCFWRFFLRSFWTLRVKVRPGPVVKPWLTQLQQHPINFILITSLSVHCNLEVSQCKQTFTRTAASQHLCAKESFFFFLLYPQTFYQLLCFCVFAVCKIYELFIGQNCIA